MRIWERFGYGCVRSRNGSSPPTSNPPNSAFSFGPFNSSTQKRWKKPVDSAQTRLENRTRDLKLDKLQTHLNMLNIVLRLQELMSKRRGPFVSVQLMSRWKNIAGLNVGVGVFLRKRPHIFDVFVHPVKKNLCCRITRKMAELIKEEEDAIRNLELENIQRIKKLLMMSMNGTLHVHALGLVRRELGLPEDFRYSILRKYSDKFKLVDLEIVSLVDRDEVLGVAGVEKWREREYKEKWLSEFETKYAFPINLPTGYRIESGFRQGLKNWQRLPYVKPHEAKQVVRARNCGGIERLEKRVVGILHEFLSLTVEKMVEVDRLVHFRRDLGMEVNLRELLLKHPGIFYISTKGNTQTVFLREAYNKGCMVEPNPIYVVRRKMLDLILQGSRNTRGLQSSHDKILEGYSENVESNEDRDGRAVGDWAIPILESFDD
ncbi:protein ROOT PRIMORDIUM DEFECTIVE 1 [Malania oleifera]|uniref:protein ROOT PRIMORDIUM DEFECTIVE 1 n=1 Tax=Malania oleifera TaxID=397392 RepID=UPI0025AE7BCB|nr:protein ROOT PRIMORDIUM DEFECTIVE 1 [Malania oleifera]XP_057972145.1 protein ROOT PRIMORDIUM DEFECTIVE 1 [Malania oleifera]